MIFENTRKNTLRYSTDTADLSYVAAAWAGGAPQDQVQYVDALVFSTETPAARDARGRPMIGPIGWQRGADLSSPKRISAPATAGFEG